MRGRVASARRRPRPAAARGVPGPIGTTRRTAGRIRMRLRWMTTLVLPWVAAAAVGCASHGSPAASAPAPAGGRTDHPRPARGQLGAASPEHDRVRHRRHDALHRARLPVRPGLPGGARCGTIPGGSRVLDPHQRQPRCALQQAEADRARADRLPSGAWRHHRLRHFPLSQRAGQRQDRRTARGGCSPFLLRPK